MKFHEDPRVVQGTVDGPRPERVFARGMVAAMFCANAIKSGPSSEIAPQWVTEQRWPHVRVRGYHATVDGALWVSPGYMTISLALYTRLWLRAALRLWREPLPRAWVRS